MHWLSEMSVILHFQALLDLGYLGGGDKWQPENFGMYLCVCVEFVLRSTEIFLDFVVDIYEISSYLNKIQTVCNFFIGVKHFL